MELTKYIHSVASQAGICADWATYIENAKSKEELMEMYVKGIDFCLEKNFPSNDDLLRLGGADFLANYGVYVDAIPKISPFLVLLGSCYGTIEYSDFSVNQLFIKGNSNVNVIATENASLIIDCFDNATLNVTQEDQSNVMVNVYGNAIVTATGNVKIIHKNKLTY